MSYKDLLVAVDAEARSPARVDLALRLAAAHGAHLTALYVQIPIRIPQYVRAQLPLEVFAMQEKYQREEARRLEADVRKAAAGAGISLEWRAATGDLVPMTALHVRYCDLAIVGQTVDDATHDRAAYARLAEDLALGSGRPVLVVPQYGKFSTLGERAIIAWNGSREATRAVNDALPLLRRAKQVTVLVINPTTVNAGPLPGADIALHLSRHGVRCEAAMTQAADDIAIGDILLSRAADLGADLIVMGAYGHSRTREMVLGGVTRHLIKHMTVPVLMSH
jgi:nucleotide-binding universal stress UspA family protein